MKSAFFRGNRRAENKSRILPPDAAAHSSHHNCRIPNRRLKIFTPKNVYIFPEKNVHLLIIKYSLQSWQKCCVIFSQLAERMSWDTWITGNFCSSSKVQLEIHYPTFNPNYSQNVMSSVLKYRCGVLSHLNEMKTKKQRMQFTLNCPKLPNLEEMKVLHHG